MKHSSSWYLGRPSCTISPLQALQYLWPPRPSPPSCGAAPWRLAPRGWKQRGLVTRKPRGYQGFHRQLSENMILIDFKLKNFSTLAGLDLGENKRQLPQENEHMNLHVDAISRHSECMYVRSLRGLRDPPVNTTTAWRRKTGETQALSKYICDIKKSASQRNPVPNMQTCQTCQFNRPPRGTCPDFPICYFESPRPVAGTCTPRRRGPSVSGGGQTWPEIVG